jgi:ABC-type transport system involved in multi-copper enzyme maturation permease subunit
MPVHEQGYRRIDERGQARMPAFLTMARSEIALLFSRKLLLSFVILPSLLPALGMMIAVYVVLQVIAQGDLPAGASTLAAGFLQQVGPDFYFLFFKIHASTFLLLWGAFVGADLIAGDRKTRALELYFTRPLGRFSYLGGKFCTLAFFLLLTTFVPGLLIWLFAVSIAPEEEGSMVVSQYLEATRHVPMAILYYSLIMTTSTCTLVLALSSLGKSWILVGALWGGYFLFSQIIYNIVRELTESRAAVFLSLKDSLLEVGEKLFRTGQGGDEWVRAAVALGVLFVLSLFILLRRIRVVETVS